MVVAYRVTGDCNRVHSPAVDHSQGVVARIANAFAHDERAVWLACEHVLGNILVRRADVEHGPVL